MKYLFYIFTLSFSFAAFGEAKKQLGQTQDLATSLKCCPGAPGSCPGLTSCENVYGGENGANKSNKGTSVEVGNTKQ